MEAIYRGKRYDLSELSGAAQMSACNLVNTNRNAEDAGSVQVSERGLTVRAYKLPNEDYIFAVGHNCNRQFFHRAFEFKEFRL